MTVVAWSGLLGDALALVIDHRGKTPKKLGGDWTESGVPVLSAMHVKGGRVDAAEARCISEEMYDRWMPERLCSGDVLLTSEAPLGEAAYLRDEIGVCLGQRLYALRADEEVLHSRFLYFLLRDPTMQAKLAAQATGTTVLGIRQSALVKVEVDLPGVAYQRQVASVLGSYDDLIENNRRRIEIVEEMVRLIYREWFVDFRFPGHEKAELVDSELGLIPEGWDVTSLAAHVELQRRYVKPVDFPDEDFAHYSIPAFDTDRLPVVQPGSEIKSGKYRLNTNCVLLSKLNPRFPRVWRVRPGRSARRSICSTEFLVVEATGDWPDPFVFSLVSDADFGARVASMAGGTSTSHQRAKPKDVMALPVVAPPTELVATFSDRVRPMLGLADNLVLQNDVLSKARDLLLPRLVSGEVDVSDVDLDLDTVA